jgi:hypothetical protein
MTQRRGSHKIVYVLAQGISLRLTQSSVVAVLLQLSGCAATITVEFPDNTRWQFTANRLVGLIAIFAVVVSVMHLGFRLVRWYMPDRRSNSD